MNPEAFDYIIKTVRKASDLLHLNIFITPKDYDIIYRWWEKKISHSIIIESMQTVHARWCKKGKTITSYSSFNYEVKKNHKSALELQTGSHNEESSYATLNSDPVETFYNSFPADLEFCRSELHDLKNELDSGKIPDASDLNTKLLSHFSDNEKFTLECENFLNGLSPALRTDKIRERFLLNSIYSRYHIPEFSLL